MPRTSKKPSDKNDRKAPYRVIVERLGELPEKTRDEAERRASELVSRVRGSRAGEALEELPERAKSELDGLLGRVGLMRLSKHQEALEQAKKRARAAGKRAARKDLSRGAGEAAAS